MSVALVLLGAHVLLARDRRAELRLLVSAGIIGLVADSLQQWLGLFRFASGHAVAWMVPPWIVVMWVQFASTFRHCLSWLMRSPRMAALLGAVGGPAAYWVGARLGAVSLGARPWLSLLSIAAVWSMAMPLLAWLTRRGGTGESGYTWPAEPRLAVAPARVTGRRATALLLTLVVTAVSPLVEGSEMSATKKKLDVGDPAPAFTLPGSDGKTHSLSDHVGQRAVVLAWFPKAFTGG
jgi:hypothetical protein